MKKAVLFIMVFTMVLSWSIAVFADFVPSISAKPAPELFSFTDEFGKPIQATIVSYAGSESLPAQAKQMMKEAYEKILAAKDISVLNKEIKRFAKEAGVKTKDLVVSDFFDLSLSDFGEMTEGGCYRVSLSVASLRNFVCLLHFVDGEWELVTEAKVSADGEKLEFTVDGLSPFAIVTASPDAVFAREPVPVMIWVLIGILGGALIDVVVILILGKKAKKMIETVNYHGKI